MIPARRGGAGRFSIAVAVALAAVAAKALVLVLLAVALVADASARQAGAADAPPVPAQGVQPETGAVDAGPPAAEPTPAPPAVAAPAVRLATVDPGAIYWQRFGHNALIIGDEDDALAYNFGWFDFEQPDFLPRFLSGRMLYQAVAFPAGEDLAGYVAEQRSVHLQLLNLAPDQARRLAADLARSVQLDNRDYLYEYFRANCSTRLRDALDDALDGALRAQTAGRSRGYTYRMHALRLADGLPWMALGIDLGLGPDADRRLSFWDEMFIPEVLRRHLREVVTADGDPLVIEDGTWFDSGHAPPPELPPDRRMSFALTGLALAAAVLWLGGQARRRTWARRMLAVTAGSLHLLFGLAGMVLLLLWLATDHIAAHGNENLFLLSPLSLLLALPWWRRARAGAAGGRIGHGVAAAVALSATLGLLAKALPQVFAQANLHWVLLLLPLHLALYRAWRQLDRPAPP
jgi:hypothetical protein